MIELCLVGIGTGNPDHVTRQGVKALNAADLILVPHKGAATQPRTSAGPSSATEKR